MKTLSTRRSMALGLGLLGTLVLAGAAQAQSTREGPQPGQSSNSAQIQRWEQEWVRDHPGVPIPVLPVLEKQHRGEILANMNAGFEQMRQKRQQELREIRAMNRRHQEQLLAAQHITWNAQQWANWERAYDAEQRAKAEAWAAEQARAARWDHYWQYGH